MSSVVTEISGPNTLLGAGIRLHRLMSSVVTEMSCSTPSRSLNGVLHRLMRSVVTEIKLDPIGSDWTLLRCIG